MKQLLKLKSIPFKKLIMDNLHYRALIQHKVVTRYKRKPRNEDDGPREASDWPRVSSPSL